MALSGDGGLPQAHAMGVLPVRTDPIDANDPSTWRSVGRNAQCPCGSGQKYKHCHGKLG